MESDDEFVYSDEEMRLNNLENDVSRLKKIVLFLKDELSSYEKNILSYKTTIYVLFAFNLISLLF